MKTRISFLLIIVSAFLVVAFAGVKPVQAATITVQDSGDGAANATNCPGAGCRLRDALAAVSDNDTIDFSASVTGTITLTSGQLEVNNSITISGPGANVLAVNGNAASRIFYINPGKTVTIAGLTITNGLATTAIDNDGGGGGIYNDHSTLTLNNCTLSGNKAAFAAGIFNNAVGAGSATLTVKTVR